MGKALLAFAPDETVDAVLARPLRALTPRTITDPAALRRELAAIRRAELAFNAEESRVGLLGVAAPIRDAGGAVAGALALAMPRRSRSSPSRMAVAVRTAAFAIGRQLRAGSAASR
jgi:IclR family acetate operon transcriptional repressor